MGGCCCGSGDNSRKKRQSGKDKNQEKRFKELVKTESPLKFRATEEDIDTEDPQLSDPHMYDNISASFKAGESRYSIARQRFKRVGSPKPKAYAENDIQAYLKKNDYQLHEKLGDGSYSEVFRVMRKKKSYALKVINLSKVSADYKQNFLKNEIMVLQKIGKKTKNIIKVFDVEDVKTKVFVIMEFAPNGTLADHLLKMGAINETLAKNWFSRIVNAIHSLHSLRIAHRDLKLENILLSKKMRPKISDFSYAIEVNTKDNPLSEQFCGSIPYFPPEILEHKPHNPLIADIWSLGVCFYIMLNDKLPFELTDETVMLRQQLNKEWKHRKNVETQLSEELKDIMQRMLEPEVSARITASQLIQTNWIRQNLKNFKETVID